MKIIVFIAIIVLFSSCSTKTSENTQGGPARALTLSTKDFSEGSLPESFFCHNEIPSLSWNSAPTGTESFALVSSFNPKNDTGDWSAQTTPVIINIPKGTSSLQLGQSFSSPIVGRQMKIFVGGRELGKMYLSTTLTNDFYLGPCATFLPTHGIDDSSQQVPFNMVFTIYALNDSNLIDDITVDVGGGSKAMSNDLSFILQKIKEHNLASSNLSTTALVTSEGEF